MIYTHKNKKSIIEMFIRIIHIIKTRYKKNDVYTFRRWTFIKQ